jgi:hypothetical protein
VGPYFDRRTGPARPPGRLVALAAALAAIALAGAGCRKPAGATHAAPAVVPQSPAAPVASAPPAQATVDRTAIATPAEGRPAPRPSAQAGETSAAELARAAGELPAVPKLSAVAAAPPAAARRSRAHHGPVVATTAIATAPAHQPAPAAPTPAAPVSGGSDRQIDDMVRGALEGTESRGTEPHHEIEALPALSREEILTAMKGIRPRIKDCYRQYGQRGMAWVRVEVGGGGAVTSATVTGTFADSPTGACVEAAVKTAHFPTSEKLAFRYPLPVR